MELIVDHKEIKSGTMSPKWEMKKLGELLRVRHGKSQRSVVEDDGPYPILATGGEIGRANAFLFDKPSVLIGRKGTIDWPQYMDTPFWTIDTLFYTEISSAAFPKFMYYLFHTIDWRRHNEASGVPSLNASTIENIEVKCPPLPEQHAIAEALSDIDRLLASLELLIAKKRNIQQATMQQLLTGKTRLPGFTGTWERVPVGELFTFKNGLNKAKEFFGTGTPIVNYMDVYKGAGLREAALAGRVCVNSQEMKAFDVRKGDVFFTRTSETVEEVGLAAVMLDDCRETVFSGFLLRARPKDDSLYDSFKKFCFRADAIRHQITSRASYTTRALTNGRLLSAVVLDRPPHEEQAAITEVLTDMDNELATLQQRRNKTRLLKQGMMQELLTGKRRLV